MNGLVPPEFVVDGDGEQGSKKYLWLFDAPHLVLRLRWGELLEPDDAMTPFTLSALNIISGHTDLERLLFTKAPSSMFCHVLQFQKLALHWELDLLMSNSYADAHRLRKIACTASGFEVSCGQVPSLSNSHLLR